MSNSKLFGKSKIDFQYKIEHNITLHNSAITHRLNALPFHILIPVTGFETQLLSSSTSNVLEILWSHVDFTENSEPTCCTSIFLVVTGMQLIFQAL